MKIRISRVTAVVVVGALVGAAGVGNAQGVNNATRRGCAALPSHEQVRTALVTARGAANGGLDLDMWGTIYADPPPTPALQ